MASHLRFCILLYRPIILSDGGMTPSEYNFRARVVAGRPSHDCSANAELFAITPMRSRTADELAAWIHKVDAHDQNLPPASRDESLHEVWSSPQSVGELHFQISVRDWTT